MASQVPRASPQAASSANDMMDSENQDSEDQDDLAADPMRLASTGSMVAAQETRASFKKPQRWMTVFGVVLAMCAGMVNVASFLGLGTLVSHLTGVTTKMSMHLEGVRVNAFPAPVDQNVTNPLADNTLDHHMSMMTTSALLIGSFIFGAFLCGLVIPENALHFGGKAFYGVALLANSAFLLACTALSSYENVAAACCASCACGLQNAMCTMHLGAVVRTTHVTGTGTDIGSTSGRIMMILLSSRCQRRKMSRVQEAQYDVNVDKLRVLLALFLGFAFGCYLGAFLFGVIGNYTFMVPAGITGTLGILYTFFRESLKSQLKKFQDQKLSHDMREVEDAIQRTSSLMASLENGRTRSGRMATTRSSGGQAELDHQISRTLRVLRSLEESMGRVFRHPSRSRTNSEAA